MSDLKVLETTNYAKFKEIRGNRVLNRKYLSRLAESVKENNLLAQNPIIVNENMQVIDGQHRLKVAETLNVPIYYTVIRSGSIKDVQMLNVNVRSWSMKDFLDCYTELNNKDYIALKEFAETSGFSVSISLALLTGGFDVHSMSKRMDDFRSGNFKVTHLEYAVEFAKKIGKLSKYLDPFVNDDREFLRAMERVYRVGIKQEYLIDRLEASRSMIHRSSIVRDYIRQIEDIISWKSKNLTRIPMNSNRVVQVEKESISA